MSGEREEGAYVQGWRSGTGEAQLCCRDQEGETGCRGLLSLVAVVLISC